jgi:LAO/AO transport system kinase
MNTFRDLSRSLTIVENGLSGSEEILLNLTSLHTPLFGITGPPGAGKSTLINAVIEQLLKQDLKIAVLAVDPTSPFTKGSLLGDRVRMQKYATHPNLFIRSIATRGYLGGLSAKTIEMTDVLKAFGFDYIFLETVGVGQSEIEIASLADTTLVVLVPQAGDEIQAIKAGLMEVGQAFIINKFDQEGADSFFKSLARLSDKPIFKTTASKGEGIKEIIAFLKEKSVQQGDRSRLIAQKAWQLIQYARMGDISLTELEQEIAEAMKTRDFNIYRFVQNKLKNS